MDEGFGTSNSWHEWSCSSFRWLITLENGLEESLGECMGDSRAISLAGNEDAALGGMMDDIMSRSCDIALLNGGESKILCDR